MNDQIQNLKTEILYGDSGSLEGNRRERYNMIQCMVEHNGLEGFARNVAETVIRMKGRCSEKQAYIIARSAVEQGIN